MCIKRACWWIWWRQMSKIKPESTTSKLSAIKLKPASLISLALGFSSIQRVFVNLLARRLRFSNFRWLIGGGEVCKYDGRRSLHSPPSQEQSGVESNLPPLPFFPSSCQLEPVLSANHSHSATHVSFYTSWITRRSSCTPPPPPPTRSFPSL